MLHGSVGTHTFSHRPYTLKLVKVWVLGDLRSMDVYSSQYCMDVYSSQYCMDVYSFQYCELYTSVLLRTHTFSALGLYEKYGFLWTHKTETVWSQAKHCEGKSIKLFSLSLFKQSCDLKIRPRS